MFTKLCCLTETLSALVTCERLISSVCSDVILECGGSSEGPGAKSALERSVSGVCHHVMTQLIGLRESEAAVAALVRFDWRAGTHVHL